MEIQKNVVRPDPTDLLFGIVITAAVFLAIILSLYNPFYPAALIAPLPALLFFIPVILASYRFPKNGYLVSVSVALMYFILALYRGAGDTVAELLLAAGNTLVLSGTGILVAYLSAHAAQQQEQYKDLFDHSEAGSLVLEETKTGTLIAEANYCAAEILRTTVTDLRGKKFPDLFLVKTDCDTFFAAMKKREVLYSFETFFEKTGGGQAAVILSARQLSDGRVIVSLIDISGRRLAEDALKKANAKLGILSRITRIDLLTIAGTLADTAVTARKNTVSPESARAFDRISWMVTYIQRCIEFTAYYQDLGSVPPEWIPVQDEIFKAAGQIDTGKINIRSWVGQIEIYADRLAKNIFYHLIDNAVWHGGPVTAIVATWKYSGDGIDLIVEDNGAGIADDKKTSLFSYSSDLVKGFDLYIDREILGVTGITINETGSPGTGARFEIHIPRDRYRQRTIAPVTGAGTGNRKGITTHELFPNEFSQAQDLWKDYHELKGDAGTDRIFGVYRDGHLVSIARCTRHADGYEIDGVFTPEPFRKHGYAQHAMAALVEACHNDILSMYAVIGLSGFYRQFGFIPVNEQELPPTIRSRYAFALGEMKGSEVQPMIRSPGPLRDYPE
ncbi:MAG: GNAT family N-acetyltransferase [Methanoregula sp.]|jgi:signal transduction histidine kinase/GNAT superfamily N-acetyltransferase